MRNGVLRDDNDEYGMGYTKTIRASNGYDSLNAKVSLE